jgi:hypothetical protein
MLLGAGASSATAQWSHNPAVNTPINTDALEQNQAKILATANGGCYMVWLGGAGYDTLIQRLDAKGVKQWPGSGVVVVNTAFSSTQDYGFAIDTGGNAIVAYRDDGNVGGGSVQIKVQKVDSAGNLLWGTGTQVSTAAGGNAPHVCASSDGGAIVTWSDAAGAARVQKVDSNGVALWTAGGVVDTPPAGLYFVCDIVSDNAGGALALYHHQTGGFSSPRFLKMQRFDSSAGAKLWNSGTAVTIFDAGSIQLGNFPALVSDGQGGAVVAWYNTGGTRNAYVQHVDATGTELLVHNGLAIADDVAGRIRVSAAAGYDLKSGDIYLVAEESSNPTQGNYNLRAQRIDSEGTRVWGVSGGSTLGVVLFATAADHSSFPQAIPVSGGGAIFAWYTGPNNNMSVRATRIDGAGAFAWTPNIINVSSAVSNKARLWSARSTSGRAILAWADSRAMPADPNDIYAQAVNVDGSLGNPGDVTDNGTVDVNDLLGVVSTWGPCVSNPCLSDIAPAPIGDGNVDVNDLLKVITNWN